MANKKSKKKDGGSGGIKFLRNQGALSEVHEWNCLCRKCRRRRAALARRQDRKA